MMNKQVAWAALGALGLMMGCGGGGTTSTSTGGEGGSTGTTTGAGGGTSASTSTATGAGGGATTSTGSGTSTSTGGDAAGAVCSMCVGMKGVFANGTMCSTTLGKCTADATCAGWFQCVQDCQMNDFTAKCLQACDAGANAASALFLPVYDCTCGACKTECGPACN